jgi:hypothetical protein
LNIGNSNFNHVCLWYEITLFYFNAQGSSLAYENFIWLSYLTFSPHYSFHFYFFTWFINAFEPQQWLSQMSAISEFISSKRFFFPGNRPQRIQSMGNKQVHCSKSYSIHLMDNMVIFYRGSQGRFFCEQQFYFLATSSWGFSNGRNTWLLDDELQTNEPRNWCKTQSKQRFFLNSFSLSLLFACLFLLRAMPFLSEHYSIYFV